MAELICCDKPMSYEAGDTNDIGDFEDWLECMECGRVVHPIPKPDAATTAAKGRVMADTIPGSTHSDFTPVKISHKSELSSTQQIDIEEAVERWSANAEHAERAGRQFLEISTESMRALLTDWRQRGEMIGAQQGFMNNQADAAEHAKEQADIAHQVPYAPNPLFQRHALYWKRWWNSAAVTGCSPGTRRYGARSQK